MKGLFHIYTGDGKGKSTAALGLALRAYGRGLKILYCQFLKSGQSGELKGLALLDQHLTVVKAESVRGFLCQMDKGEYKKVCRDQRLLFSKLAQFCATGEYNLAILDEAVTVLNQGIISLHEITEFIKQRPQDLEVVFTGRDAPEELIALADYVSEIKKIKHPYDQEIGPRRGIEF